MHISFRNGITLEKYSVRFSRLPTKGFFKFLQIFFDYLKRLIAQFNAFQNLARTVAMPLK